MNNASATRDWSRGYYCAVAMLLRESGCVTTDVRSLFTQGGGQEHMDPADRELFTAHGLLPAASSVVEKP